MLDYGVRAAQAHDVYSAQRARRSNDAQVLTMVRRTRGDDIDAACGQLKGQVMDRTRRQAEFRRKLEGQGVTSAN